MQQLKNLMSRDVKVISPDMSIQEAAREMRDGDFGLLPVGEDDRMIGTISDLGSRHHDSRRSRGQERRHQSSGRDVRRCRLGV